MAKTGQLDDTSEQELTWTHNQADIIDPLHESHSSSEEETRQKVKALEAEILKIKEPYKGYFGGYDI
ncbi:hypothetical protein LNTAR_15002 [Lentisphaera araneosa HTCC2155]|uniref:Uncharacterized protein n=1 Tax=Lentisphaera araneosa HTCC2155 TaxID=313628 RepID=A6DHQ2_9BACT|nr:hypothetical protein [Lentisphaera araneosa]EDM29135.1 hypothetical protein LNTAR_15002 [Lentisphaera araneosa HTCC2155]